MVSAIEYMNSLRGIQVMPLNAMVQNWKLIKIIVMKSFNLVYVHGAQPQFMWSIYEALILWREKVVGISMLGQ